MSNTSNVTTREKLVLTLFLTQVLRVKHQMLELGKNLCFPFHKSLEFSPAMTFIFDNNKGVINDVMKQLHNHLSQEGTKMEET